MALLTALISYEVVPMVVASGQRGSASDTALVDLTAWASQRSIQTQQAALALVYH